MPRLSKEDTYKLEAEIVLGKVSDAKLMAHYDISSPAYYRIKKRVKPKGGEVEGRKLRALTKTLEDEVKADAKELKEMAFTLLKEAVEEGDAQKLKEWFDRAQSSTKLRADIGKSLNLFVNVDNRDQSTTVNVTEVRRDTAREIFGGELRCPECGADVSGPLLAKHAERGDDSV